MLTAANEPAHAPVWEGIYEPAEAARYLRATENADVIYPMHSTKLVRWIRRGFADPELTQVAGRDLLMGFDDLISMRVIAALRATAARFRLPFLLETISGLSGLRTHGDPGHFVQKAAISREMEPAVGPETVPRGTVRNRRFAPGIRVRCLLQDVTGLRLQRNQPVWRRSLVRLSLSPPRRQGVQVR